MQDNAVLELRGIGKCFAGVKAVENVEVFDIYRGEQVGEGKKSMAFKLTFVPGDKAFSPKDIESFMKKIQSNLKYKLNVDMR